MKELIKDERGVSPVVGTILLIAITVILAGTIGFFAMQQGTPEAAPTVSLSVEDGVLYHNGGDTLAADSTEITLKQDNGTSNTYYPREDFEAGDSIALTSDGDLESSPGDSDSVSFSSEGTLTVVDSNTDSVLLREDVDFTG